MSPKELSKTARKFILRKLLIIFVCSVGSSMLSWDEDCAIKGSVVEKCIKETILILRKLMGKEEFYVAQIVFARQAELRVKPKPVDLIDLNTNFNPLTKDGGNTAVVAALNLAYHTAEKFLLNGRDGVSRDAVIVMISNGKIHRAIDDLAEITRRIKLNKKIILATALYGRADKNPLKEITPDPEKNYQVCKTADQLGEFILAAVLR